MSNCRCNLVFQLLVCLLCCDVSLCGDHCAGRFRNCICKVEETECHEERNLTDIKMLLPYIRTEVRRVVVTGSYIRELDKDVLGPCHAGQRTALDHLDFLALSNNHIARVDREAFNCMPNLEVLDLSQNDWVVDPAGVSGYFTALPNLKRLDLTNSFSDDARNQIIESNLASLFDGMDTRKLEILILSYNELSTLSQTWVDAICSMTSLNTLDLSHNKLRVPGILSDRMVHCLDSLEYLDVSFNKLSWLPTDFFEKVNSLKSLKSIRLGQNNFICNCHLVKTFDGLRQMSTHIDIDRDDIVCATGHPLTVGKAVLSLHMNELCPLLVNYHGTSSVKPSSQETTLREWRGLTTTLREWHGLTTTLREWRGLTHEDNYTDVNATTVTSSRTLGVHSGTGILVMDIMLWIVIMCVVAL